MACNLSFIVKWEGVHKVTGSHVRIKSGSISKTVLHIDDETTATNSKWYMAYLMAAIAMTLDVRQGHSSIASFSNGYFLVARFLYWRIPAAIAQFLVIIRLIS